MRSTGAVLCATAMTILGTSFPVSRELTGYPTLTSQAVRYLVAAALLAALARRSAGRAPYRRELLRLAGLAATGLAAFNVCVLAALRHADPAVLGTVIGGTPLLLAILGPVLLAGARREPSRRPVRLGASGAARRPGPVDRRGRRPSARVVGCGAVVVAGIALVQGGGHASATGLCWALGALAGEVFFSLLAAPLLDELGPVRVSAWACALAVPQLAVAALVAGEWRRLRVPTAAEGAALLYLAVVLTVVAFLCWYGGLRRLGVERAGMFAGLLPVASLAGTAVIDHAVPAPGALLGTLVVAAGLGVGATGTDQAPVPVEPDGPEADGSEADGSEADGSEAAEAMRSAARTRSA